MGVIYLQYLKVGLFPTGYVICGSHSLCADVGEFYVCVLMVLACFVIQGIFISYDSTKRWNVATAPVGDVGCF